MYDSNFMIRTFDLKDRILSGAVSRRESGETLREFEARLRDEPLVFNVETTSYCNMRCVFCQRTTDFTRKPQHMTMETFNNLLSQMTPRDPSELAEWRRFVKERIGLSGERSENDLYYNQYCETLTLHGFGEPLLDPHLPERIAALTAKGIPTYFSANPCNIKLDFIEKLFHSGLGLLKFAIDSLDDERVRELRGRNADFTQSHQKILDVLELKRKMNAETIVVATMLDTSGDFGPGTESMRFMELWRGRDVYAYVKSLDNKWLLNQKGITEIGKGKDRSHYASQYCEFPWTSVTILADGSVAPCTQDVNGTWTFGNVNEESLAAIWKGKRYREFRAAHVTGDFEPDFMCHAKCDLNLLCQFLTK